MWYDFRGATAWKNDNQESISVGESAGAEQRTPIGPRTSDVVGLGG